MAAEAGESEFEILLRDHAEGLYRLGRWLSGSADVAEELVQEAALRAYRRFDTFDRSGSFKAWMSRILTNVYIDRYRRKHLDGQTTDFQESEPVWQEVEEPAYFEPAEALAGYAEHVDGAVKRAVEDVPLPFRTVFLLYSLAGLSYKEIAETLAIPMGTVMSRLFRARGILKRALRGYAAEAGYRVEEEAAEASGDESGGAAGGDLADGESPPRDQVAE